MPSRQDRRPSPSEDTAAGTPAPRRWVSVRGGSRKSHRGTPSPRPAPTPAPPRSAPPCRPRWECLKPWSHPSSGSPPPVEVVNQPHLELLDRHTVGPSRSAVTLHL